MPVGLKQTYPWWDLPFTEGESVFRSDSWKSVQAAVAQPADATISDLIDLKSSENFTSP